MAIIIEPHYFPSIPFFSLIKDQDEVIFEVHESWQKQSFRNRCTILGPNGPQDLIIPVTRSSRQGSTKEWMVDDSEPWRKNHWRSIQAAYGRSPYFEYYGDQIKALLNDNFSYLFQFQEASLSLCLELLDLTIVTKFSKKYIKNYPESVFEARSSIHPKKDVNIDSILPYTQVFGKNFVANLSIVDLLFCTGPEGVLFIPTLQK